MARSFTGGNYYLGTNVAVISAAPLTMCCWFRADNITATTDLMSIGDTATSTNRFELRCAGGVAGDPITAATTSTAEGGPFVAESTAGYSANNWHHAAAVFASSSSRAAYLDGGNKGTGSNNVTPTSLDATAIGRLERLSPGLYHNGDIAEAAIWDVALTDKEVAMIARGVSPLKVRPKNLVSYWPLYGNSSPEPDVVGDNKLTVTGATKSAHPRIFTPQGQILSFPVAAGGGVTGSVDVTSALSLPAVVGESDFVASVDVVGAAGVPAVTGSFTGAGSFGGSVDVTSALSLPAVVGESDFVASVDVSSALSLPAVVGESDFVGALAVSSPISSSAVASVFTASGVTASIDVVSPGSSVSVSDIAAYFFDCFITLNDINGPIVGASVWAVLSGADKANNVLVNDGEQSAVTDVNGMATLRLFANSLGSESTSYEVFGHDGVETVLRANLVMPARDINLWDEATLSGGNLH